MLTLPSETPDGNGQAFFTTNGTNSLTNVPNNRPVDQMTAMFWFKNTQQINHSHVFYTSGNWNFSFGDSFPSAVTAFRLNYPSVWTNGSQFVYTDTLDSTDDDWHHFLFSYDGDMAALYVDGVKVDEKSIGGTFNPGSFAQMQIGYGNWINLDNFRVFPVAYKPQ